MRHANALPLRGLLMAVALAVSLVGCASVPDGPTWSAIPGTTRSPAEFETDNAQCRAQTGAAAGASQQHYDQLYYSCMYAHGHRVPAPSGVMSGGMTPSGAAPATGGAPSVGMPSAAGSSTSRPPPPAPPAGAPPAPPRSWIRG